MSGLFRSTLWRRSATAAGIYVSVLFGFLGTLVAARELGPHAFGLFSIVLVTAGFFQTLLDLTAEEALVKYGFRYVTAGDWGRLRRLFRRALAVKGAGGLVAAGVIAAVAPAADAVFGTSGLETPLFAVAALPLLQSPENVAGSVLILRGRYDVRGAFLAVSMALRFAGLAVGAGYGVTEAAAGVVAAQAVATVVLGLAGLVAFRRFPVAPPSPLGADVRPIVSFVFQSSLSTGVVSLRGALAPILLGVVTSPAQVGFFRIALTPQQGFASLSAPARLILLTEQTRDWERGAAAAVFAGVRRYTLLAAALTAVVVPPLYAFAPELVRLVFGTQYAGASDALRLILLAGAVQLMVGWSKSFPVSIGRPGLRILAHGVESVVIIPLVVVLGAAWDAAGAAGAVLAGSVAFAAVWAVLVVRIRRRHAAGLAPGAAAGEATPT